MTVELILEFAQDAFSLVPTNSTMNVVNSEDLGYFLNILPFMCEHKHLPIPTWVKCLIFQPVGQDAGSTHFHEWTVFLVYFDLYKVEEDVLVLL